MTQAEKTRLLKAIRNADYATSMFVLTQIRSDRAKLESKWQELRSAAKCLAEERGLFEDNKDG